MRKLSPFILLFVFTFSYALNAQDSALEKLLPSLTQAEEVYFQKLVEGNNRFAFDFYQKIKNQNGNLYFSSYGIMAGLAMIEVGAKGEAVKEYQRVFRYLPQLLLFIGDLNGALQASSESNETTRVLFSNVLWLNNSLSSLASFNLALQRNFKASLQTADFSKLGQSIEKINQLVSQQTNGKITGIASAQDLSSKTQMLLTTASVLSGKWENPFDQKLTKRMPFQITKIRTLQTDMMHQIENFLIFKSDKWALLSIPFQSTERSSQLFLAILLPNSEISFDEIEKNFTWQNWNEWKKKLKYQRVAVTIPRFRIDKRLDLEQPLKSLGFTLIFTSSADFSGMTNQKGIFLNKALHKSAIRIDEKGADISVLAKKNEVSQMNEGRKVNEFIADRPFLFIVYDQKTESIISLGRLNVP